MNDRVSEEIEKLESQRFQLKGLLGKIIAECEDKALDDYNSKKISKEELEEMLKECNEMRENK
jgi:hypothetical protein